MKRIFPFFLTAFVCWMLATPALAADLRFFSGFGSGAVLQREMPAPVWGWAGPNAEVTVSFAGQKLAAKADDSGHWLVEFQPLAANATGADLTATAAGETVVSRDVVVGEVWFCSGQSNMADHVGRSTTIAQELARPVNASVRHFRSDAKAVATSPQREVSGQWLSASPTMLQDASVSAVAYYFARRLNEELKVPVGVIVSAVGATNIQSWLPATAFDLDYADDPNNRMLARLRDDKPFEKDGKRLTNGGYKAQLELIESGELTLNKGIATSLYNAQVAPHAGTAIRGITWYQGEANRGDAMRYYTYLHALVDSWRAAWKRPELPFYFAQISAYNYNGKDTDRSAEIWEAQTYTLKVPNTAMVVTHDIGDLGDIHPPNKKPVGERLALQALNKVYGRKDVLADSPRYLSHAVDGDAILVKFRDVGDGLKSSDGKPLSWFTVAGKDGVFVPAEAQIVAPDTVRVAAVGVAKPTNVRFAWDNTAQPNLANSAGLPAAAFRSDGTNLGEP